MPPTIASDRTTDIRASPRSWRLGGPHVDRAPPIDHIFVETTTREESDATNRPHDIRHRGAICVVVEATPPGSIVSSRNRRGAALDAKLGAEVECGRRAHRHTPWSRWAG